MRVSCVSKPLLTSSKGATILVLVFILAVLMGIVLFSLLMITTLERRRSIGTIDSHETYYAVEGGLHDTLQRFRLNPDFAASNSGENVYLIGNNKISRQLSEVDVDGDGIKDNIYDLTLKSKNLQTNNLTSRETGIEFTFEARMKPFGESSSSARPDADIILVLDRSGSMSGYKLTRLKETVNSFLSSPELRDNDRIAIVSFSSPNPPGYDAIRIDSSSSNSTSDAFKKLGEEYSPGVSNRDYLKSKITNLTAGGNTEIFGPLVTAGNILRDDSELDYRHIILFSDGAQTSSMDLTTDSYLQSQGITSNYNYTSPWFEELWNRDKTGDSAYDGSNVRKFACKDYGRPNQNGDGLGFTYDTGACIYTVSSSCMNKYEGSYPKEMNLSSDQKPLLIRFKPLHLDANPNEIGNVYKVTDDDFTNNPIVYSGVMGTHILIEKAERLQGTDELKGGYGAVIHTFYLNTSPCSDPKRDLPAQTMRNMTLFRGGVFRSDSNISELETFFNEVINTIKTPGGFTYTPEF